MILGLVLAILIPTRGDAPRAQNFTIVPVDPSPSSAAAPATAAPGSPAPGSPAPGSPAPGNAARPTGPSTSASRRPSRTSPSRTSPSRTSALRHPLSAGPHPSTGIPTSPGPRPATGTRPAGDTGVPPGTALTVHQGDLVITKSGASYDALDVHGFVVVEAPNVTIRRSIIRGGLASGAKALVSDTDPAGRGFVIEDSELVPDHPSVFLDGLAGAGYTATRLDIHGTVDGAKVFGDHVRITSSWLHDLRYYPHDPAQNGGPTHNDGVQVLGGSDIAVTGNRIAVTAQENSGLQVTQDHGATTDLRFEDNQVDGGTCSVKLSDKGGGELGPITIRGNTFGRGTGIAGCAVLATHATRLTASDNRWRDTGAPVITVIYH